MTLVAETVALTMIESIKPLVDRINRRDRALADQLRRAASSVALNIGEARYSRGGNSTARFENAMGSASEARSALRVARAWGYVSRESVESVDKQLDRIVGLLWGLTRKKSGELKR